MRKKKAGMDARKRARRTKTVRLKKAGELRRLLRPLSNYEELARKAAKTWAGFLKYLRVPGLTPKRLVALVKKAERAQDAERKVNEALALKGRAAQEKRMFADDEAYRALLDVNRFLGPVAEKLPHVAKAFEFLTKAFSHARGSASAEPPASPPAP